MTAALTPHAAASTTQLGRIEADVLSILSILKANATQDQTSQAQVIALLQSIEAMQASGIAAIMSALGELQQEVNGTAPDGTPASVRFLVPSYRDIKTGKSLNMATNLANDVISNVPLVFDNLAGQMVPPPSAGTISLSVVDSGGNASSAAVAQMGADGTSVDITPSPADGTSTVAFTVKFSDSAGAGLTASADFVFTNDTQAANVHFDTTKITTRPIPAPTPSPAPPATP